MKINWINHFIELLIVIIGISIAFWFNNLAEITKEKNQEIAYLTDILNDLKKDSIKLNYNLSNNEDKSEKLQLALDLIGRKASLDSTMMYVLEIGNYNFFSPDNFTLTSLLQSGDLKLIQSKPTKRELLRLLKIYESIDQMQRNLLQALDDNYFPMLLNKVDMVEFNAIDPDFFYSIEIKNYCAFTINETNQHMQRYAYAQKQVDKVMRMIEADLK